MATKKQWVFFIPAILLTITLLVVVVLFIGAFINKNDISLDIAFIGSIAAIAAVVLALISIGVSVKEPEVNIFLGNKHTTESGTILEIRINNRGNALGNIAHAMIEIEANSLEPITFNGAPGLDFLSIAHATKKQYRFDDTEKPRPLYPAKYNFSLLGFISKTPGESQKIKLNIQVVGIQGRTRKKFTTII